MSGEEVLSRHAAAYRRLLGLYPAGYRREVGDAAVAAFSDLCRAHARKAGGWGLVRIWLTTLPRLLWGGVAERISDLVRGSEPDARSPYGWAVVAGGLVLLLYVVTLAPTTQWWDTSEYIATAHIQGIPHPPGNPLFVVLARAWELLLAPLGLAVATRINLFSAFMSASAHGLWFLVVHHILRSFSEDRRFRLAGAAAAVLVSATAFTVWNQSNVNEKVYTVSLLTIALLSWLAFRWQENLGKGKDDNLLVLMAFILALSVGNHLMAFLAAPAIGLFILVVHPRVLVNWKLYPAVAIAALVGLSIHLFLPIRAALGPVINEGAEACGSILDALVAIGTYGRAGCQPLSDALTRKAYVPPGMPGPGFFGPRQAPVGSQLLLYLQYFDWQWARSVQGVTVLFADLRIPFTMLFTGLGVWGATEHARRDRRSFLYVLALFSTLSLSLVYYLNFKYGYSIGAPSAGFEAREVRERDYFFTISFSIWGLWAGVGIAAVWHGLSRRLGGSLLRASPVLGLALVPITFNWAWADRSHDYAARDFAYNLLQSVEPYGVLFTNGDNDTFPLWYLQEVEGVRQDVSVIVTEYLKTPWYAKQLREKTRPCPAGVTPAEHPTRIVCQRPYQPDLRAAYTSRPDTLPAGVVPLELASGPSLPELPILQLDDATIDRAAGSYVRMDEPLTVQVGTIRPTIPGGQILYPWQQLALAIVDTAFTDGRPVYWSTTGFDAATIGLEPYLIRQGLAFKIHDGKVTAGEPSGVEELSDSLSPLVAVGRFVDVPRTKTLAERVFVHRSGLPFWSHWPDASTFGVPLYYSWIYESLALAANAEGNRPDTLRYLASADAWRRLAD